MSPQRRIEILGALRRGAVPHDGLDFLAVGLDHLSGALDEELEQVATGRGVFKAVRGEYGTGKTFFTRWLGERARQRGFATAEVQISETETPLHRLETVYRRAMERLTVANAAPGALHDLIERWFYTLERDVLASGAVSPQDEDGLDEAIAALMESRLVAISRRTPQFGATLRAWHRAQIERRPALAQALLAWLAGQPNVGAEVKRYAGLKGDVDHFGALSFLEGLLVLLRDSGMGGLVLILDEVETLQRVRSDTREKSLNALRQLIDEVDGGRVPGLYVVITGTPAFYEGPQGVARLAPLAQRLHTDFSTDARWDNPRAVQVRLTGMGRGQLIEVGRRIRDLYQQGSRAPERVAALCDDAYIDALADAVTGRFGGQVRIAPRLYLKKLVADVLDRVDQFPDFDPRRHYALTLSSHELTAEERFAAQDVDDIDLDLGEA
jgi:hypothetical protein